MLVGFLRDVLRFMEPEMMSQIVSGEVEGMQLTQGFLLAGATVMVLPILMVFLSLTLPYKANRWANIIVAIFVFGFDAIGLPSYAAAYAILLIVVGLVFNVLTIAYSWRWRKQDA